MGKEVRAHSEMPVHSRIEFKFGSVGFWGERKTGVSERSTSEQGKEPSTNSSLYPANRVSVSASGVYCCCLSCISTIKNEDHVDHVADPKIPATTLAKVIKKWRSEERKVQKLNSWLEENVLKWHTNKFTTAQWWEKLHLLIAWQGLKLISSPYCAVSAV